MRMMFPSQPFPEPDADDRGRYGNALTLGTLRQRLRGCKTPRELFAVASSIGPGLCGFERGLVLSVVGDHLTSNGMDALDDPASDTLRHRCQLEPIALSPESEEAQVIRSAQGGPPQRAGAPSVVARTLGLEEYALAAVVPESEALALVAFDRPGPPVSQEDHASVQAFAYVVGLAVTSVALRLRLEQAAYEIRYLAASANAVLKEAQEAPVALSVDISELARTHVRLPGGPR